MDTLYYLLWGSSPIFIKGHVVSSTLVEAPPLYPAGHGGGPPDAVCHPQRRGHAHLVPAEAGQRSDQLGNLKGVHGLLDSRLTSHSQKKGGCEGGCEGGSTAPKPV